MNRRHAMAACAAALCWPAALAQVPGRVARVVLGRNEQDGLREEFRKLFAEHGWHEGKNLELRFVPIAYADDAEARVQEVIASRPDAILMPAAPEISLIKRYTRDIPFVFYNLGTDPAGLGVIQSLNRPGGNITGTSMQWELVWSKAWELLKALRPSATRAAVLGIGEQPHYGDEAAKRAPATYMESTREATRRLGMEVIDITLPKEATLEDAKQAIRKARPHVIQVQRSFPGLLPFLENEGIASLGLGFGFVRNGGLLGASFDNAEGRKHAVAMVARILRGESPATMPVYQHTTYGFAVNTRVARSLDITIPPSVRMQVRLIED